MKSPRIGKLDRLAADRALSQLQSDIEDLHGVPRGAYHGRSADELLHIPGGVPEEIARRYVYTVVSGRAEYWRRKLEKQKRNG